MKRAVFFIALSLILSSVIGTPTYSEDLVLNNTPVKVLFNPGGGCLAAILAEIDNAKTDILVQAYSFTSSHLKAALVEAHKRGVKVEVILDKGQRKRRFTSDLMYVGIPIYIDAQRGKAHNKVLIIDGATVITGSFNFTKSGEKINRENVLILKSGDLAKLYTDNWKHEKKLSELYKGVAE